jgi:adhesin transport system outer membrane protein
MFTRTISGRVAGQLRPAIAAAACLALSGCFGGGPEASRSSVSPGDPALQASDASLDRKGAVVSALIDDLRLRQTILPAGGPYDTVARAVLEAGAASAEAELRVKRLSARARSKNWLPSLGPEVSLSSLGSIMAQLVLDQTILDNGKRKAERDFAAADVEVAAISLATDLNAKVYDGLKLYIEAERARELATVSDAGLKRMAEFDRIMKVRYEGGLSDGSEARVISQKRAEMEATLSSERMARVRALAELNALTSRSMDDLRGLSNLPADTGHPEPLAVMQAKAEGARTIAELTAARAGYMPGLGIGAALDKHGDTSSGISLDGNVLGFGRKDSLQALEEGRIVAIRRIEEADRNTNRTIVALGQEIATLNAQSARDAKVLAEMEANLGLFTEQYKAGRRTLLELVNQFESLVAMRRNQASIKYQIAVARVEIAKARGVLVSGASM